MGWLSMMRSWGCLVMSSGRGMVRSLVMSLGTMVRLGVSDVMGFVWVLSLLWLLLQLQVVRILNFAHWGVLLLDVMRDVGLLNLVRFWGLVVLRWCLVVGWGGVLGVHKLLMMHWRGVVHGGMHLDFVVSMMRHGVVQNGRIQIVVHDSDMLWRGQVMLGNLVMNGGLMLDRCGRLVCSLFRVHETLVMRGSWSRVVYGWVHEFLMITVHNSCVVRDWFVMPWSFGFSLVMRWSFMLWGFLLRQGLFVIKGVCMLDGSGVGRCCFMLCWFSRLSMFLLGGFFVLSSVFGGCLGGLLCRFLFVIM